MENSSPNPSFSICDIRIQKQSWSPKGKPWHNGAQESFYRTFKLEGPEPHQLATLDDLIEAIARYMLYYNTERIHRRLKMPPKEFYRLKKWKRKRQS